MNTREQIESLLGKFVVITFPNFVPRKNMPNPPVFYRQVIAIDAWYDQARAMMGEKSIVVLNVPISTIGFSPTNRGAEAQECVRFKRLPSMDGVWFGEFPDNDDGLQVHLKLVSTAS